MWIKMPWQHISPEVTVKGFIKSMGNDMLWNDSEKDVDVRSECEEDNGTHREDGDSDTDW
jgi:hypothetical protein